MTPSVPRPPSGEHLVVRAVAPAAALVSLVLVSVALSPPAEAGRPSPTVSLDPLGTYAGGVFEESAAEIPAFDPGTGRAFVVNAQAGTVDVLDLADPTTPTKTGELATPGANSVAVRDGLVAVAEQAGDVQAPGTVVFFDAASLERLGQVTVGALPDMLTFTPDGRTLLVANEGEPSGYGPGYTDPEGSVSVVDVQDGVPAQADVRTAGFGAFDRAALLAAGVRLSGPGASVARTWSPST